LFPPIQQVTVFKRKILEIWRYAIANKDFVSNDIYNLSHESYDAYQASIMKEKTAKATALASVAKLNDDMKDYEISQHGIPPGVVGVKKAPEGPSIQQVLSLVIQPAMHMPIARPRRKILPHPALPV
jgi:hypothetical protein